VTAATPGTGLDRRRLFWIVGGFALVKLVLLLATSGRCGYFIDEFYYLACARHLAWGYVDQPPFSIALLRLWTGLFGDGLVAIRVPMALSGAGTMVLTGILARDFGARSFGVLIAGLTILADSAFFGIDHFYSMNGLETLLWTASLVAFARIVRGG
jgi:4-amino-4-deoxy-L-arabinose transferase-like glycosyltransferase